MFSFDDRTRALLVAIASASSVSAAARIVGWDVANAHRHLRKAEERAGARLVDRQQGSRLARLTAAGARWMRPPPGSDKLPGVAVLRGRAGKYDAEDGTTRVEVGRRALHVAGRIAPGPVMLSLAPESVALSREAPASSARNALPARVVSLREHGEGTLLVEVVAGAMRLRSLITRGARRDLRLREGSRVVAVVKATAIVARAV